MLLSRGAPYDDRAVFAIDLAGSELPQSVGVRGCLKALRAFPRLRLILVGDQDRIRAAFRLSRRLLYRVEILHTDAAITMDEEPVRACLRKPDASVMLAAGAVADGRAFGFYSPGNTGAAVTAAIRRIGVLPGVRRPALAAILPTGNGSTLLLDCGAGYDATAEGLLCHARLAQAYVGAVFQTTHPKIGLLNIGSETNKGNRVVRRAHALFRRELPGFMGNVEGYDIFSGKCDIVVCDGFIGNILIKLSEGLGRQVIRLVRSRTEKSFRRKKGGDGDSPLRVEQSFTREMRRMTDSEKFGGVPLLGVQGIVLVGHGQARSRAVYNAIRAALVLHANGLPQRMREAFPGPNP